MESREPQLAEVILAALDAWRADLHVSIPARVERYDETKLLCDVKPLVRDPLPDGTTASVPVICNVPVAFQGGGGFRVTFPVKAGDTVLLVFGERSLDRWLNDGGEVDPVDPRRHDLSDAVAIPGLRPFAGTNAATSAHATDAVLEREGGGAIHITDAAAGSLEGAALGHTLAGFLAQMKTWLDGLVLQTAMGPTGPGSASVLGPSPTVPTVESATVKLTG